MQRAAEGVAVCTSSSTVRYISNICNPMITAKVSGAGLPSVLLLVVECPASLCGDDFALEQELSQLTTALVRVLYGEGVVAS